MKSLSFLAVGLVVLMGIAGESVKASTAIGFSLGDLLHPFRTHQDLEDSNPAYEAAFEAYLDSTFNLRIARKNGTLSTSLLQNFLDIITHYEAVFTTLPKHDKKIARKQLPATSLEFRKQEIRALFATTPAVTATAQRTTTRETKEEPTAAVARRGDDDFTTLELVNGADWTAIRKSYLKLAHKYHPDRNPTTRAAFEQVHAAYKRLEARLAPTGK